MSERKKPKDKGVLGTLLGCVGEYKGASVLTSVFVINQTNEHKDNDISLILDYAFRRFYGANTNLFLLACAGKTKEQIMPEVQKLLEHTQYKNYMED